MNEESKTKYILVKQWMNGRDYMMFIPFKDLAFHASMKGENGAVIDGIKHEAHDVYYIVVDPSTYEEHDIDSINARFPDELKMKLEVYGLVY